MTGELYTVDSIGGMVPTQAEGTTADGRPFYFRARHGVWRFTVAPAGGTFDDAVAAVQGSRSWHGKDPSFGCMTDPEVREILDRCLAGVTL